MQQQLGSQRMSQKASMPYCAEDVLLNILSFVPTRSLVRSRLVCKAWDKMIADPYLARIHSRSPISGFFDIKPSRLFDSAAMCCFVGFNGDRNSGLASIILYAKFHVEDSCNGLICFVRWNQRPIVILHPVTRSWAVIHPPESSGWDVSTQLLHDPKKSPHFKIIRAVHDWCPERDDSFVYFQVFSSKDSSWSFSPELGRYKSGTRYITCTSLGEGDGAVCWLDEVTPHLRGYDIGTRSVWESPTPVLQDTDGKNMISSTQRLIPSGGRCICFLRQFEHKFIVWKFKGKGEGWLLEGEVVKDRETTMLEPLAYDAREKRVFMRTEEMDVLSYHLPTSRKEAIAKRAGWELNYKVVPHWNSVAAPVPIDSAMVGMAGTGFTGALQDLIVGYIFK